MNNVLEAAAQVTRRSKKIAALNPGVQCSDAHVSRHDAERLKVVISFSSGAVETFTFVETRQVTPDRWIELDLIFFGAASCSGNVEPCGCSSTSPYECALPGCAR